MILQRLKNTVVKPLVKSIPFAVVSRITTCKPVIVYYHIVNDEECVPHVKHLYSYKLTSQFRDDLDFLCRRFTPTGLLDLIHSVREESELPQQSFLLTFDDGFREIYDVIAPILLEKGIPATFFISSAFLDNKELCYQHKASIMAEHTLKGISKSIALKIAQILRDMGIESSNLPGGLLKIDYRHRDALDRIAELLSIDFHRYLEEKQPYLTSDQIRKLMSNGFTIGSHSIDHPYYSALSVAEQLHQTIESTRMVRETFDLDYGAFAFPHNDTGVEDEFFEKIEMEPLIDVTFGTGGLQQGSRSFHRQRVSLENPPLPAGEILAWQYLRKVYRQANGKRKCVR